MDVSEAAMAANEVTSSTVSRRMPQWGDPAPWFQASTHTVDIFNFHTVAGRPVVLSFLGQMRSDDYRLHLNEMARLTSRLPDLELQFYCVSSAPELHKASIGAFEPHVFYDSLNEIAQRYGVDLTSGAHAFVLDERLRVIASVPLRPGYTEIIERELSKALPSGGREDLCTGYAPVLIVPRIFEPGLCNLLTDYYERMGGEASGFMRDVGGLTRLVKNPRHKIRRDAVVDDEPLRASCRRRIASRLIPEIKRVFQFDATRIERYVVACYDSEERGHFSRHRDNTTLGTAHRQFAVSINLNTGEYDGGGLRFPEFGMRLYQPPLGGAVVFSCSLLHEARPVTKGKRYAFLPFLYNEDAAKLRSKNQRFVGGSK